MGGECDKLLWDDQVPGVGRDDGAGGVEPEVLHTHKLPGDVRALGEKCAAHSTSETSHCTHHIVHITLHTSHCTHHTAHLVLDTAYSITNAHSASKSADFF